MGDRALVQFTDGDTLSPCVYLHWDGDQMQTLLAKLLDQTQDLMKTRGPDVAYVAARFVGICHEARPGNLSLGLWNQDTVLTAGDSHGDAGCFVIDVRNWTVATVGGYGFDTAA